MKFTIKELNVLVRGAYLALQEAERIHSEYNTEVSKRERDTARKVYDRIDGKLWDKVKKDI